MKVIIIKKWKTYNIDDVVEVSNGFGTNFLIKNGYALPLNKATNHGLEVKLEEQQKEYEAKKAQAIEIKSKLEKESFVFFLKTTEMVIHGSISTKKVNQALIDKGYKLEKHSVPHIAIASLGITKIPVKIFDDVIANIEVEVRSEK